MPPKKRPLHLSPRIHARIQPFIDKPGEIPNNQNGNGNQIQGRQRSLSESQETKKGDEFERLLNTSMDSIEREFHLDFHFDDDGNLVEEHKEVSDEEGGTLRPESVTDSDSEGEPFFGSGTGDGAQQNTYLRKYTEERAKLRRLQTQTKLVMGRLSGLMEEARALRKKNGALIAENRDLNTKLQDLKEENEELELQLQAQATHGPTGTQISQGQRQGASDAQRRAAMMRGLFSIGEEDDDLIHLEGQKKKWFERLNDQIKKFSYKHLPFNTEIRAIEARYGSSVAAYFVFFQWIILQYIFYAFLFFPFMVMHLVKLYESGSTFVSIMEFSGILPYFMLYSSYGVAEKDEYGWLLFAYMVFTLGVTLRKWLVEDKKFKVTSVAEEQGGSSQAKYSKLFLCSWDHSLAHKEEVTDLKLSNGQTMVVTLEEEKIQKLRSTRTNMEIAVLVCRRVFGGLFYMVLQFSGWYAIIYLTLKNSIIQTWCENQKGFGWAASSVVPAVVSFINALMPAAIKEIVKFEKWDTMKMVIKQLTVRMYLSKILNAFIQILSYLLLANPLFAASNANIREAVEQPYNSASFACRADQVGVGLFQLVATEFVVSKVIALATPYGMRVHAQVMKKKQVKPEFETAKSMVSLLYFAALALVSTIFAPTSIILILLFYLVTFLFEMHILVKFKAKPKRPWKASDAGSFFIKFYLATSILSTICIWFFLDSQTFPKSCSIQDSVQLCTDGSYSSNSSLCIMDSQHVDYQYMSVQCPNSYPSCICKDTLACGPFINETSAWTPLEMQIKNIPVLGSVYTFLRNEVLVLFILALCFLLAFYFRSNSFYVFQDFAGVKDRMWQATVQSLESRVRKLQKNVDSLQMQMQSEDSTTLVQPLNI